MDLILWKSYAASHHTFKVTKSLSHFFSSSPRKKMRSHCASNYNNKNTIERCDCRLFFALTDYSLEQRKKERTMLHHTHTQCGINEYEVEKRLNIIIHSKWKMKMDLVLLALKRQHSFHWNYDILAVCNVYAYKHEHSFVRSLVGSFILCAPLI